MLGASAPAYAARPEDEHAAAVEAFHRGTQLVETGRLEGAIAAFREALSHEPASVGARLDLADCYEKIGSPASAWRQYAIAEVYATRASDQRREMARSSAARLANGLLVVTLSGPRVPGLEVRVDGDPIGDELLERAEIAVAPGRHRFDLVAPGKRLAARDVSGVAGETRSIALTFDPEPPPAARSEPPPLPDEEPRAETSSSRHAWGVALGALGVAGIAVGAVAGAVATSDKSRLEGEAHDPTVGLSRFNADRSTADTFANVSTGALIGGGVALVAGVVLYLTTPTLDSHARAALGPVPGLCSGLTLRF